MGVAAVVAGGVAIPAINLIAEPERIQMRVFEAELYSHFAPHKCRQVIPSDPIDCHGGGVFADRHGVVAA